MNLEKLNKKDIIFLYNQQCKYSAMLDKDVAKNKIEIHRLKEEINLSEKQINLHKFCRDALNEMLKVCYSKIREYKSQIENLKRQIK